MNRTRSILLVFILLAPFLKGCSLLNSIKSSKVQIHNQSENQSDTTKHPILTGAAQNYTLPVLPDTLPVVQTFDSLALNDPYPSLSDSASTTTITSGADSVLNVLAVPDSLKQAIPDSLSSAQVPKEREVIESPIDYNSADSLAFTLSEEGQMAHLFGNAKITYGEIELTAGYIQIDFQRKEISAKGITDSTGVMDQKPHFKQGTEEFDCTGLRYNFETGKGFVENIITKQQDGIVHSEKGKMITKEVFCLQDGKFSICDAEHPHFYLFISKGKVLGKKAIITGRSYLVLEDFPIYFPFLPYGYLPTANKTYSSGIIIPSYGEEAQKGFYLRDGGFYWAASDYFDFTIKGDIYSKGSWALKTTTNYRLRYKFSGSLGINTSRTVTGVLGIDQKKSKDFSITWTHSQDAKANPNQTISASVNFSTSGYDRENEFTDYNKVMQNTKRSNVSYQRNFPNTPFKLSMNISATQSSSDTTVNLELPTFTLNMKTIEPFKKKNRVGKKKFYEDITLSYSTNFKNTVKVKEYELLTTSFSDWQKGVKHNIGIGLPTFKLFKNITVSPSFNYDLTWHFNYINRYWVDGYQTIDEENMKRWVPGHVEEVEKDGFRSTYSYGGGISTSTTLYGLYQMRNPNSKIKGIRHKMTPSLSFNLRPDFTSKFSDWVQSDSLGNMRQYSHFAKTAYPYTAGGKSGSISLSLSNNLEMKVANEKDSTSTDATKKISLIDNLSLNTSYDIFKDSMNLAPISWGMRIKLFNYMWSINGSISPYALDARGVETGKYMWTVGQGLGRLGRLTNASTGFSYSISSDKIKKMLEGPKEKNSSPPTDGDEPSADDTPDDLPGFQKFSMPWSFNLNYTLSYSNTGLKPQVNQNLSFSGNIDITSKWKANFQSGFNFRTMRFNSLNMGISRSLHCWNMAFQFSPVGPSRFYTFTLNANSSMLKDLKVDKTSRSY